MAKRNPKFLVIDGCPVPYDVAPYIYLILRRAKQTANSIYRGDDAKALLHKYGKSTQREIHNNPRYAGISNPPGFSTHELFSDGAAYRRVPRGRKLESWQVGVDSGGDDQASKSAIEAAARHYGLRVFHPYNRGVENHHWNFVRQPIADGKHLTKTRVILTRAKLRLGRG